MDMILDWMAKGGAKNDIPDSPYDAEARIKREAAIAAKQPVPVAESELDADPDLGAVEDDDEVEEEEVEA
jgi:hypothetical protein